MGDNQNIDVPDPVEEPAPPPGDEPPAAEPAADGEAPAAPEGGGEPPAPEEGGEPLAAEGEGAPPVEGGGEVAEGEAVAQAAEGAAEVPPAEGEAEPEFDKPADRIGDEFVGIPNQAESYEFFVPKLYDFEVYNYDQLATMLFTNTKPDNLEIRCPDFHILLDHTIALIYLFYNDVIHWSDFNVPQIEWALKFIGGIVSEKGQCFKDMDMIRSHLELLLFETYCETNVDTLNETPPTNNYSIYDKPTGPIRKITNIPIPESIKEVMSRAPTMATRLCIAPPDPEQDAHNKEMEIKQANTMKSAYIKLNNFEKKHLSRITEEIELFEMIKALKLELGYNNGTVNPNEITTLRLRMEELEKKLLDQAEQ